MPSLLEHAAARLAYFHARGVYARFRRSLAHPDPAQERVLRRVLAVIRGSDYARRHGLERVRTLADLRRAAPLADYESYRPYIDRLCDGDTQALLAPGERPLMFATSSGTTAAPKRIPVTRAFVDDYRRGWNTFGLKMLSDHPRAILRPILQSSGRHDAEYTSTGVPCGAITGLLALTQKRIVRRFYVGRPELAHIDDAQARYYTLMRLAVVRDVAFAITANPATLIRLAQTADTFSEALIRDVRDGTLAGDIVAVPQELRRRLSVGLRPAPPRATELERLRSHAGRLAPRDYWNLEFLACWTGGSMGHYLQRLADWWGPLPVRDVGLLASEGRVSIPLDDGTPSGVLDIQSGIFEFIPATDAETTNPQVLTLAEVEPGHDYAVVLTNTSSLIRYRLNDIVRVTGRLGQVPLVEFLHRAGRVASIAGEKLTENQAVAAARAASAQLGIPEFDFLLAPCWADPPFYRLSCPTPPHSQLAETFDLCLARQNEEYASRRKSGRLGPLIIRAIQPEAIPRMDARLAATRRASAEQYKRSCLFAEPGSDDQALDLTEARN